MPQREDDDLMAPQGIEGYEKAREPYFSNLASGTTALPEIEAEESGPLPVSGLTRFQG